MIYEHIVSDQSQQSMLLELRPNERPTNPKCKIPRHSAPACAVQRTQDHPQVEDPRRDTERLAIKLQDIQEHNNVFNHIQLGRALIYNYHNYITTIINVHRGMTRRPETNPTAPKSVPVFSYVWEPHQNHSKSAKSNQGSQHHAVALTLARIETAWTRDTATWTWGTFVSQMWMGNISLSAHCLHNSSNCKSTKHHSVSSDSVQCKRYKKNLSVHKNMDSYMPIAQDHSSRLIMNRRCTSHFYPSFQVIRTTQYGQCYSRPGLRRKGNDRRFSKTMTERNPGQRTLSSIGSSHLLCVPGTDHFSFMTA